MPILLDTNVYLFAMQTDEGAAFFERRFVPHVFQTFLSSIVVQELYAGAIDHKAVRLVERYVGALERAERIVTPSFRDWKDAGKLVARITRKEPARKSGVQQMLNDILLSFTARRIGAELFTFDRSDFELIRRHKIFSLNVLVGA